MARGLSSGKDRNSLIHELAMASGKEHLLKKSINDTESHYDVGTGTWYVGKHNIGNNDLGAISDSFKKQYEECRNSSEKSIRESAFRYLVAAEAIRHVAATGDFMVGTNTDTDEYTRVSSYLRQHPESTMKEVAEWSKIDIRLIEQWSIEGKLKFLQPKNLK